MNFLTKNRMKIWINNSESDLCDDNVMTSDIPDKSDNQQINGHTNIQTQNLQINSDVRHYD